MGPRIYPSYQDTNLTAKGSLILTEDVDIAVIDVYVNNNLAAKEYSTVDGLYVVSLNIGDVVRIEATNNFNVITKRYDYTTYESNGDNGIKVTDFGILYNISAYTFTVETFPISYNFEYHLDTSPFFINLVYEYSGQTNPDNLYTMATINQRVNIDGQQFNIPGYTYNADTGFTYNIGQVFITGGTSQTFDARSTLINVSGGDCVRWQFTSFTLVINGNVNQTIGTSPISTPPCGSGRNVLLGIGPISLEQNATYTVRRRDVSQNIPPTPTPTPTLTPTPTVSPTPAPTNTPSPTPTITSTPTATPTPLPPTDTPTPSPTPLPPTATPTVTPTPTPLPITVQYRYNGFNGVSGTKNVSNISAVIGGTSITFSDQSFVNLIDITQSTSYGITPGTKTYQIRRSICKTSGADQINSRFFALYRNSILIASSSSTTNFTISTCPSTLDQTINFPSFSASAGDVFLFYWQDSLT